LVGFVGEGAGLSEAREQGDHEEEKRFHGASLKFVVDAALVTHSSV
jgi:hypothetical protein